MADLSKLPEPLRRKIKQSFGHTPLVDRIVAYALEQQDRAEAAERECEELRGSLNEMVEIVEGSPYWKALLKATEGSDGAPPLAAKGER